jgi:hypothetical protein
MGRATVRVPDHWVVDASALPIMGSVDEERFAPITADIAGDADAADGENKTDDLSRDRLGDADAKAAAPPATGPPPRLRLRGFVMMGKVEVTS